MFWIRKTGTEEYWQESSVSQEDVEGLYDFLIEQGLPQTIDGLAFRVIERRCREEDERIEQEQALRPIFQPQQTYEVGQQLTFPSEGGAVGKVIGIRPGNNPAFGEFSVIAVQFLDKHISKQFATGLRAHPSLAIQAYEGPGEASPIEEVVTRYGPLVTERLEDYLQKNEDFVSFEGEWLLEELMADIHIGYLNLSEAIIEEAGRPLTAGEMVDTLELPQSIDRKVQVFSLDVALSRDDRFVQVGHRDGQPLWSLLRLGSSAPEEG